jgi:hypothetical protein
MSYEPPMLVVVTSIVNVVLIASAPAIVKVQ